MWWMWVIAGGVLLGLELLTPGSFFLFFLGLAAATTGVIVLSVGEMEPWLAWTIFSAVAASSLVLFRNKLRAVLQRSAQVAPPDLVGESGVVIEGAIGAGYIGTVELRGVLWRARNTGSSVLTPGTRVRVEAVTGLQIDVVAS